MSQHRGDRQVVCAGCSRTFVKRGLLSHLEQSIDPCCVAVRQAMFENLPGIHEEPAHGGMAADEDDAMQPQAFDGDFFGTDYGPDEFPGFEEADNTIEEDSSEEMEPNEDDNENENEDLYVYTQTMLAI
jgi:hypothetical protein